MNLEVRKNNLVESPSRQRTDMVQMVVDSAWEEVERQSLIGRESEDDNCGKLNLKIDCSWFVRAFSRRKEWAPACTGNAKSLEVLGVAVACADRNKSSIAILWSDVYCWCGSDAGLGKNVMVHKLVYGAD